MIIYYSSLTLDLSITTEVERPPEIFRNFCQIARREGGEGTRIGSLEDSCGELSGRKQEKFMKKRRRRRREEVGKSS